MIGVLIIPTGLGAAIGGDAGDGNPVAKLIAQCCDTLITHPNVVNASDINEMTENTLYVEGSMLNRFLQGEISLKPVRTHNRILVVANAPVEGETINAVSAARATIGIEAEILELPTPFRMVAKLYDTYADGEIFGVPELLEAVSDYSFDALAMHTPIELDRDIAMNYYKNGGINPWGGVEARASRYVATALNKPVAHAPTELSKEDDKELYFIFRKAVDPRAAAEVVSSCYFHCVLKGLHLAPRIGIGLDYSDVDFLLSPYGCWGPPHEACRKHGIPVISVRENTVYGPAETPDHIVVDNYLEAAGLLMTMRSGVVPESVRAVMSETKITRIT